MEKENKFTPGPWSCVQQERKPFAWEIHTPTTGGPEKETIFRKEIGKAYKGENARLIASAPDLLSACESAYELLYNQMDDALVLKWNDPAMTCVMMPLNGGR